MEETNVILTELNKEELEGVYGELPEELLEAPIDHIESIEGTLEEDEGVVFDEVSE